MATIFSRPDIDAAQVLKRLWQKRHVSLSGCWEWTGATTWGGYAQIALGNASTGKAAIHRVAYELFVGPIPDGYSVDHLCHNADSSCVGGSSCRHRRCWNPDHLEAVTQRENQLRSPNSIIAANLAKEMCSRGHPFSGANLRIDRHGHRDCRACQREMSRESYYRIKALQGNEIPIDERKLTS